MIIGLTDLLIRKIEFRKQLYNILKIKRSFLSLIRQDNTRLNSPWIVITNSEKTNKQILKHCFVKVVSLNTVRNWKGFNVNILSFRGTAFYVVGSVSLRPHEVGKPNKQKTAAFSLRPKGRKEKAETGAYHCFIKLLSFLPNIWKLNVSDP